MTPVKFPDRYHATVIPHIFVQDAPAAIEFYKEAFGAVELFRVAKPDGMIVHSEMTIGRALIMIGDADPPFSDAKTLKGASVGLHVYVNDVDAVVARAIEMGATSLSPISDMFYGARMGMLQDPYGHVWVFLTHTEDVAPEEIERRGRALLAGL
jgi:PhnB protein